jgi:PAS domain S-box-containing protein
MSAGTLDVLFAAVGSSPDAVGIGRDGRVVRVNAAMAAMYGYDDPEELIGRPLVTFTSAQDRDYVAQRVAERAAGDMSTSVHRTRGVRKDGTTFDVESTVTALVVDGVSYSLSINRDVSDQRKNEDARREREEFYRAMFEVNTAIKLLIDPADTSIIDANPAAADFYGWSLDQLRRMKVSDINTMPPEQILAEMERARSRTRMAFRFRHRLADGSTRDVDVYSGPVTLRGRTLLLSIIHDVTERNQLEDQLRRAQRLDAIGRLAAGIAHDFNNLLTVVLASAQIAERQLPAEHRVRTFLGDIRHAAQRGAELTRQLLAFARQQALAPVSIDLNTALARVASLLERVLGDDIEVARDVAGGLPLVRFDPGQLELAIINVALNARDAMPRGGTLTLRAIPDGAYVKVTVEDTGSGMDPATRARVFEPFFTTKAPGEGTGLGLASVYGIVTQSGGQVAIDSAPGEGTRIHLWLPLDPPRAPSAQPAAEPVVRCAARTVLIVDDRGDVLAALARALADAGITVEQSGSAKQALVRLAELDGAVDVVLSDIAMPGRSGYELAADVRARWPRLPVVLMSGNPPGGDAPPEVAAFLDKPFTLTDVLTTLDRVVKEMRARGCP